MVSGRGDRRRHRQNSAPCISHGLRLTHPTRRLQTLGGVGNTEALASENTSLMLHNEDYRVKIPALLHLTRLGYSYLSLKGAQRDEATNIFTELFRTHPIYFYTLGKTESGMSISSFRSISSGRKLSGARHSIGKASRAGWPNRPRSPRSIYYSQHQAESSAKPTTMLKICFTLPKQ